MKSIEIPANTIAVLKYKYVMIDLPFFIDLLYKIKAKKNVMQASMSARPTIPETASTCTGCTANSIAAL